jgi:ABC-type Fe3+-hydroxamate transport system substrate-binding protein
MRESLIQAAALALLPLLAACSGVPRGTGAVVFGPSITELVFEGGAGDEIRGADRFSNWPPEARSLPRVGGYLDPSAEAVAAISPAMIISVGHSASIEQIASASGASYHPLSFDRLEDVRASCDSLEHLVGARLEPFLSRLDSTTDSIRTSWAGPPPSAAVAVWHQPGDGSVTLAGRDTWLGDLCLESGIEIMAPGAAYPVVSVEGVLAIDPDYLILLNPGDPGDPEASEASELVFWQAYGLGPDRVRCAFGDHLTIPGSRLHLTAIELARLCTP